MQITIKSIISVIASFAVTTNSFAQQQEPILPAEPVVQEEMPAPEPEPELNIEDFLSSDATLPENETTKQLQQTYQENDKYIKIKIASYKNHKELATAKREKHGLVLEQQATHDEVLDQRKDDVQERLLDESLDSKQTKDLEKELKKIIKEQEKNAADELKIIEKLAKAEEKEARLEARKRKLESGELPENVPEEETLAGVPVEGNPG